MHDLRLVLARAFNRWLLTGIVTGRTVFATGLTVTRSTTAWAAALGWRSASAGAAAGTRAVLATLRSTTGTGRCSTGASSRCARTATTALVVLVLVRADVISAVTKVVYVVITELVRRAVGVRTRSRLTLFTGRLRFPWLLLTGRTFAASSCRFFLALFLALVFTTTATARVTRTVATWTARRVARVTHIRTLTYFRLFGFYCAGVKTHQVAIGDFLLGHALNAFQQFFFVRSDQRDRLARTTGTASTADTVNVIFIDVWQLEVDHVWQLIDIQTASGDIGGYQNAYGTGLEIGQGFGPCVLALVTVDGHSAEAVFVQVFSQTVGTVLGTGEDQNLFPGACGNQVRQQGTLVGSRQTENALFDTLDRGVRRRNFDAFRVAQQLAGQIGDVLGERRREQQVLTLGRQTGEDFFHVMDEAHVKHPVGFVEHQNFNVGQVNAALAGQVEQTTRAGNQYVDTAGQCLYLRVRTDTAKDAGTDELQVAGIELEALMHLGGEFASRGQDQHAWLAWAVALGFVRVAIGKQLFQNRKSEAAGFASTCLSRNHQVATLQHGGNGPLLHRSRLGIARSFNGAD